MNRMKEQVARLLVDYEKLPENTNTQPKRVITRKSTGLRPDPFGWFNVGQATEETNRLNLVVGNDCGWLEIPEVSGYNDLDELHIWLDLVAGRTRIQLPLNKLSEIKYWVRESFRTHMKAVGGVRRTESRSNLPYSDIIMKSLIKTRNGGISHSFRIAYITPPFPKP